MNKNLLIISLLALALIIPVYSQDVSSPADSTESDSTWANWDKNEDSQWDKIGSHMFDFKIKGAPTIELNYGGSKMRLKSISDKFANPGIIELKLGYTSDKSYKGSDYVTKYTFKYFHISNFTTSLSGNENSSDILSNTWRFGIGWASGFGYDFGNDVEIIPYYQSSFDWTMLNLQSSPSNNEDINTIDLFNKDFRFGNSFQGGIKIKFLNNLGLDASYEKSIVYSRHLFWKWGGSEIIEVIGQGLIDKFVDEILDSSPDAVPVVNFLLKNALSYGLFELKQDKMNWPFETVPPLALNQFKIGLSFVF
jgi:opacity protein-like surface antigen